MESPSSVYMLFDFCRITHNACRLRLPRIWNPSFMQANGNRYIMDYKSLLHLYYNYHYVCCSMFANCRSQFLLDRIGKCLKLFVSTDSTFNHEFASLSGLDFFIRQKLPKPQGYRAASASFYFNGQHCCQRSGPSRLGANE